YVNEGVTFDAANAHQAGSQYHYHANPPGLRHALGDSVDYDGDTNSYIENFFGSHSPILGWVADGLPIYGPYGYSDPLDSSSPVRRMISGYQKRDGTNGSDNLNTVGRQSLPQWVDTLEGRTTGLNASQYGPDVSATYILGHYLEDYAFKGDLGLTLGSDFDLNAFNARYCVTPEFPDGTWAYFTCIEEDGTPAFPYNISLAFYGDPVSGAVNSINESVTVLFQGGANKEDTARLESFDGLSGEVTISWDIVEGGSYRIESTEDMEVWNAEESFVAATDSRATHDVGPTEGALSKFYRIVRESLAGYDE
ncbi:MAG: YHYH protein, partial [Verrucomicrobiota bacterium]